MFLFFDASDDGFRGTRDYQSKRYPETEFKAEEITNEKKRNEYKCLKREGKISNVFYYEKIIVSR